MLLKIFFISILIFAGVKLQVEGDLIFAGPKDLMYRNSRKLGGEAL